MKRTVFALALVASAALTGGAFAATPGKPIPAGRYHCIAGSTRMMLTLGDMEIKGTSFSFAPPPGVNGPKTKGSYAITPTGYRWTGDIGAITNAQIVESGPDATPGNFWFKYKGRPTSSPTTLSCQKI